MSDLKDIAEHGTALVAGAIGLAGLSASGLMPLAVPVAVLAAITYDSRAADARKIVTASAKTTLASLAACADFHPDDVRAARAALAAVRDIRLSANEIAVFLADPQPAVRLTERLFGTLATDTPATRQILTIAMGAALESLRAGKLESAVTQDLVLAILSTNQAIAAELAAINARIDRLIAQALADKEKIIAGQDRELTLTRELIVALARRVTPAIEDFNEARAKLNRVITLALEVQKRGALPTNLGGQVDAVLREVADLNKRGEVQKASARLDEAIREAAERQKAENLALFRQGFDQATMLADAPKAAAMLHRVLELDVPDGAPLFAVMRAVQDQYYVRGRDFGLRFDLALSVELARLCVAAAPDDGQRGSALNGLGISLQTQGSRTAGAEGAALLGEAVAAYCAALRVRNEAETPFDWATTQNNLGNALAHQGSRTAGAEGAALLGEAVAAYRAALRVRSEAETPLDWAVTQVNLALTELALAIHDTTAHPLPHLRAALTHVEAALRVYDPDHTKFYHDKATRLRTLILDRLTPLQNS